jgi:hypothetical protein
MNPVFDFFFILCLICIAVAILIHNHNEAEKHRLLQAEKQAEAAKQAQLDTAMRGATLDLARRKAGLEPLGFDNAPALVRFLNTSTAATVQPSPDIAQDQPIPVGEVLDENAPLPVAEASVLIPERILSVPLAPGVNGVIGFYAGESVAVRSIHVADPSKFGLPVSDYSAGQVLLDGRSDEQLLSEATALFPGVFLQIVTDPATEAALRIRVA